MSDYVVGGQTYTFPDTYSDEQARDILVRHGVIKLQGGGGAPPEPRTPAPNIHLVSSPSEAKRGLWEGTKALIKAPWTIGHVLDQPPTPPVPVDFDPSKAQYYPSIQNMINRIGAAIEPWRQNLAYETGKIAPFAVAGGVGAAVPEEAISSLPARAAYGAKEGAKEAASTFDIYHPLTIKPLVKGSTEAIRAMGRYGTPESIPYTTGAGIPLSDLGDPYGQPVVPPLARGESRQIPYEANPRIPLMETGGTGPVRPPIKPVGEPPAAPQVAPSASPAPAPAAPAPKAQAPAPYDVPFGEPTVVPPEALPSQDWRFEDARDMARLLNQHGIDPRTMGPDEWKIAAPALKRNLGVPNDRAAQLVRQEWNKLQPRAQ